MPGVNPPFYRVSCRATRSREPVGGARPPQAGPAARPGSL